MGRKLKKLKEAEKNKEENADKVEEMFSDDEVDEAALAFMNAQKPENEKEINSDSNNKKKKKKQKIETEEEKNEAAKLSLLMMNPDEENLKSREKSFKLDVNDKRMGAIFDDPDFAIDPTNPNFKSTEGIEEFQRRARKCSKKKKKKKENSITNLNNLVDSIKA